MAPISAPEVNGRAFLGVIKVIRGAGGPEALSGVVAQTRPETQAIFAKRFRVLAWYPYDAFCDLLVTADRVLGRGDYGYCRTMGVAAGERDINTILKLLKRLYSPERLIRSCKRVWKSYYRNAGRMEAISWTADQTVLRIHDFPGMHPAHCRLMEGWMIRTMREIGVTVNDDAAETECTSSGGPYHEFSCTWSKGE